MLTYPEREGLAAHQNPAPSMTCLHAGWAYPDHRRSVREGEMSLLSKVTKFGLAKKVFDEVRKPENQEKIRRMASTMTNRGKNMTNRGKKRPDASTTAD